MEITRKWVGKKIAANTGPHVIHSLFRSFPRRCFISDDCIKDLDGVRLGIEYIEMRGYHASNAS
jgi:hypothetical protein